MFSSQINHIKPIFESFCNEEDGYTTEDAIDYLSKISDNKPERLDPEVAYGGEDWSFVYKEYPVTLTSELNELKISVYEEGDVLESWYYKDPEGIIRNFVKDFRSKVLKLKAEDPFERWR